MINLFRSVWTTTIVREVIVAQTLQDFDQSYRTVSETIWLYVSTYLPAPEKDMFLLRHADLEFPNTELSSSTSVLSVPVFLLLHRSGTVEYCYVFFPNQCKIIFAGAVIAVFKALVLSRLQHQWTISNPQAISSSSMLIKLTRPSIQMICTARSTSTNLKAS